MTENDVIFTPYFVGTHYKHHLCSECSYKLHLDQSIWGGVSFPYGKENIHFCPGCGKKVVRFSDTAIYETPINYEPLNIFYEVYETYRRKCQWIYHCFLSDDEREQVDELFPFAQEGSGWLKIACNSLRLAKQFKLSWQKIEKLKKEFGENKKR